MKWRVLKVVYATLVASVFSVSAFSQNYYLVIGAFSTEKDNVKEITSFLPGNSADTAYTVKTDNSTLQFYVMKSTHEDVVVAKSLQLRSEVSHPDEQALASSRSSFETSAASSDATGVSENIAVKPHGKYFKFIIADSNGDLIPGSVHQLNPFNGTEVERYQTDRYIDISRPAGRQPMELVCAPFGYKPVEKFVDYTSPWLTEGAFMDDRGAWVIPYSLEKLEAGDVSLLYNVSFYNDAVVMLPTSKTSLDQLVDVMKNNPDYAITVHAHCNGKNPRKIIALGEEENYFEVTGSKEIEASAKQLTRLRAEAVKSYLAANGIEPQRVKVYAWGGSNMLAKPTDPNSKINDRIEIEILKH